MQAKLTTAEHKFGHGGRIRQGHERQRQERLPWQQRLHSPGQKAGLKRLNDQYRLRRRSSTSTRASMVQRIQRSNHKRKSSTHIMQS